MNKDVENLKESDQSDDGFDLPEEPVARFCGDPNGPILLYADGRIEQKTIPASPLDTDPKKLKLGESMRERGAGSGDPNHPGNPGHVGDSSSDGVSS